MDAGTPRREDCGHGDGSVPGVPRPCVGSIIEAVASARARPSSGTPRGGRRGRAGRASASAKLMESSRSRCASEDGPCLTAADRAALVKRARLVDLESVRIQGLVAEFTGPDLAGATITRLVLTFTTADIVTGNPYSVQLEGTVMFFGTVVAP